MREINIKPLSILLEPFGRNTAPAVTLAALKAQEFEKTSKYNDLVCMKTLEGGIKEKTYKDALERIKKFGNEQDFEMFKTLYENSKPRCCLPKGHKGTAANLWGDIFINNEALHTKMEKDGLSHYLNLLKMAYHWSNDETRKIHKMDK